MKHYIWHETNLEALMQQLHKSHFIWSDLKPGLGRDVGGCLAPLWRRGDLERSFLVLEINEKAVGNWSLWCKIFECKLLGNIGAWKTCWLFCTTMSSQTCHERLFHRRSLRNTRTLSSHSRRPEKTCFPLYNIGNLESVTIGEENIMQEHMILFLPQPMVVLL